MNAQETDLTEAPAKKRRRPRLPRFSMLREFTLADVITLGNGFSGMSSVPKSLSHHPTLTPWLSIGAPKWCWKWFLRTQRW